MCFCEEDILGLVWLFFFLKETNARKDLLYRKPFSSKACSLLLTPWSRGIALTAMHLFLSFCTSLQYLYPSSFLCKPDEFATSSWQLPAWNMLHLVSCPFPTLPLHKPALKMLLPRSSEGRQKGWGLCGLCEQAEMYCHQSRILFQIRNGELGPVFVLMSINTCWWLPLLCPSVISDLQIMAVY